jgi:hypothetical protein
MPGRRSVLLIFAFWTATLGLAFYRDVWPLLFASGPPPVGIDLVDEATPHLQVKWSVVRGDQKVGRLTSGMSYVSSDDTVWFYHQYAQLQIPISGVWLSIPKLITSTHVTRAGDLIEQRMEGQIAVLIERRDGETVVYDTLFEVKALVEGKVGNGVFTGHCTIGGPTKLVDRDLEPVAVPNGQVLNPLQPVNRLTNVRPGQQWVVQEISPLEDALGAILRQGAEQHGFKLPDQGRQPLIAEVLATPQTRTWGESEAECWVIEYRTDVPRARTWVRVKDGKVLRQEAFGDGERIALEREE